MKKNLLNAIKEHKGAILKKVLLIAGSAVGIGLAAAAFKGDEPEYEDYNPEEDLDETKDENELVNEEPEECNEIVEEEAE